MILSGGRAFGAPMPLSEQAILAGLFMVDDGNDKGSAKSDWDSSGGKPASASFMKPEDFDIYVNKITGDTYIFHGPDLPEEVERLEYDPAVQRVNVITKSGKALDLGVKIQWLVRPYFTKARTIYIVQTKNGEAIDGVEVPLVIKGAVEG